jgi:hypothetical protein
MYADQCLAGARTSRRGKLDAVKFARLFELDGLHGPWSVVRGE